MSSKATRYKLVGICPGGRIVEGQTTGAPDDSRLCAWGINRGAVFVVRFMPSKKGWRITDIRNAHTVMVTGSSRIYWKGFASGKRIYPSEDAAVMRAVMICTHSQPKLL